MAVGCLIAGLYDNSYWAVVGLSLATIGLYASNAHLFPLPAVFLTGPGRKAVWGMQCIAEAAETRV